MDPIFLLVVLTTVALAAAARHLGETNTSGYFRKALITALLFYIILAISNCELYSCYKMH